MELKHKFYFTGTISFGYITYLDFVFVDKLDFHFPDVSSHCLEVETVRLGKPNAIPLEVRHGTSCHLLEDEFRFLECSRYTDLRTIYTPQNNKRTKIFEREYK